MPEKPLEDDPNYRLGQVDEAMAELKRMMEEARKQHPPTPPETAKTRRDPFVFIIMLVGLIAGLPTGILSFIQIWTSPPERLTEAQKYFATTMFVILAIELIRWGMKGWRMKEDGQ